ncbi:teichoic acid transport system permease [Enterococcus sp. DIV0788_1]|nr:ABC transporter permease [Enterococcus devriesei]MBU5364194.1 ABC transporter permease [Enterococcus devriesei]
MISKIKLVVKEFFTMFSDIVKNRGLLRQFARNDFQARYAGNFLGIVWGFLNPIVTVFTYWFIFAVGFKAAMTDGKYPFVAFLITGLVPWLYFQDVLMGATNVFREYSYLVKKVVFNIKILPTVKLFSNLFLHFFFCAVAVILCALYGFYPTIYLVQIIYYMFCLMVFLTALTWITASIQPFVPDISQFIAVIMQALMWATPVLYSINQFSGYPKIVFILKLNPLYYVVTGYRDSIFGTAWFWEHPSGTIYFWAVTLILSFIGIIIFRKLRPHFSDVL